MADALERQHAEIESLQRFKAAYEAWSTKTEWFAREAQPQHLGKHIADAMRDEIESLRAQLAARVPDVGVPLNVLEDASAALGNFCADLGWADSDMLAMDNLDAFIARHKAVLSAAPSQQAPAQECEWTNCPRRVGDVCCNEQQAPVAQGAPVLFVSEGQLAAHTDAPPAHGAAGNYIPPRKTPAGKFTTALYTHPQQASEPMTPEQRRRMIDEAGFKTEGLTQDDFAQEIVSGVERHHQIKGKQ